MAIYTMELYIISEKNFQTIFSVCVCVCVWYGMCTGMYMLWHKCVSAHSCNVCACTCVGSMPIVIFYYSSTLFPKTMSPSQTQSPQK